MDPSQTGEQGRQLDDFIEAYESARARGLRPALEEFLPATDHLLRQQVLARLVLLDLRHRWAEGQPRPLADYQRCFPDLAADPAVLGELAREEDALRLQGTADTSVLPEDAHHRLEEAAQAYQRFRLRTPLGDLTGLDSWCATFPGVPEHAELFREVHRSDPQAAYRLAEALTSLPGVGETFLGFRLVAELGRGTFGKVYLARQGDLADRPVALKVAVDLHGESQALAQLQHTNIVPIYSAHRAGPFHAVCMPYLGRTTLADVLRDLAVAPNRPASGSSLVEVVQSHRSGMPAEAEAAPATEAPAEKEAVARLGRQLPPEHLLKRLGAWSYVEAVLWMGARLADGLAHAHERGIVHRDLKPANVLLTDEGQPMLVDFNLAEDTKLRCEGSVARIGGTLPYMSPEQLLSFEDRTGTAAEGIDGRSDVYSLGVILYELLAGRRPFPSRHGPLHQTILQMAEDRSGPAPPLRQWNRAVSPATESIVRHCLACDPDRRYRSSDELREDLQRQLEHRPLRHAPEPSLRERLGKWVRRHPVLTARVRQAATLLALLATVALGIQVIRSKADVAEARRRQQEEEKQRAQAVAEKAAQERLRRFGALLHTVDQLSDALTAVPGVASTWPGDDGRRRRAQEVLHAGIDLYGAAKDPGWRERPALLLLSAGDRARLLDGLGYCYSLLARLEAGPRGPAADPARVRRALELNRKAEECVPTDRVSRGLLMQRASLLRRLGRDGEARRLDEEAAKRPVRGERDRYLLAYELAERGRFRAARDHLEQTIRAQPNRFAPWLLLGVCYENLFRDIEAVGCYSACIALNPGSARSYFDRGSALLRRERWERAAEDFTRVLRLRPNLPDALANRAFAYHGDRKYTSEVADLTQALRLQPGYVQGYFARAEAYEALADKEKAAKEKAAQDRKAGFERRPDDVDGYLARAIALLTRPPAGMSKEAARKEGLANVVEALKLKPDSLSALEKKAEILADHLGNNLQAVATLDRAIDLYPDYTNLRINRALLHARLGRRAQAVRDIVDVLAHDRRPLAEYYAGCVYAQTSRSHPRDAGLAVVHLKRALRHGFGLDRLGHDRDLKPLARDEDFRRLRAAVSVLAPRGTR